MERFSCPLSGWVGELRVIYDIPTLVLVPDNNKLGSPISTASVANENSTPSSSSLDYLLRSPKVSEKVPTSHENQKLQSTQITLKVKNQVFALSFR